MAGRQIYRHLPGTEANAAYPGDVRYVCTPGHICVSNCTSRYDDGMKLTATSMFGMFHYKSGDCSKE